MKKMNRIIYSILAVVLTAGLSVGCAEKFDEIETLDLTRCLEPMNLSARVSATLGDVVTFSWDVSKDAEAYILEVFTDKELSASYMTKELAPADVPYTVKLEADKTYYYRVQATATGKSASKYAVYDKKIETFAVKDNLYMKVADRAATSVTLSWSKEVSDYEEVTRIDYGVPGADEKQSYELTAEDIAAAGATVSGLTASTEYVFTLYYLSASRGEVNAWTTPDVSVLTPVSTLAELQNAILTSGAQILLKMEGSPYDIEMLDFPVGVSIYGEESADGTKPVLQGEIHVPDTWKNGDALYFEGVEFNGNPTAASPSGFGFPFQKKNGGTVDNVELSSVIFRNCIITNYSKGLIYEWSKTFTIGELTWDSCEISNINADGTGGGDCIDFRGASTVNAMNIVNNTIYQGMRTFIRLDAGTWGDIKVDNNTVMNLNFVDNTNNAGFFGIQPDVASLSFRNNLIMGMVEKATMGSANTKYKTAEDLGVNASNNWFYNIVETYFTDSWPSSKVGYNALEADPCYNAAGGFFNISPESAIAGKEVGASKWWTPYVEEPEDLSMTLVEGAKTWDLGNARYFSGTIKKEMVRDRLFVSGSESNPIVCDGGMLNFKETTVLTRKGVPSVGYLKFMVDTPGSVILKPADPDAVGNHLVVGVGPVDGSSVTIKGGASALADMDNAQKIIISTITEPSYVYVWASGAVSLAQLAWSTDVTAVNTALATPAPKTNPASVTAGDATDIEVSWESVENAGSYTVVFNGKAYDVEEGTSYIIGASTVAMLDAGPYTVDVYANPGEKDIYNTESAAGTAAFAVLPKGGGEESSEFVVSSVEEFLNAVSAGKDAITFKYSDTPYEVGSMTVTTPLHLKGQTSGDKMTKITASFTLSGEIGGSFVLRNFEIVGDGTSVIVDDKTAAAPVVDTVAIYDSYLHGTKALYDNSGKAESNIQYVIFKGNLIEDSSDGADYIDMRAGAHHNFIFENNTVSKSCRTFIRTDAGHEMNTALIKNNTFYKVATNSSSKDNNGILHIRSAAGAGLYSYVVKNNFFYSILIDEEPSNAAGFPKLKSKGGLMPSTISNNWFFNVEEREEKAAYSFFSYITKEEATADGGAVITVDPTKDAEGGDFTLVNAVLMNAGVGDPRWNAMAGGTPSSDITVTNLDELLSAIAAGKATITLAAGDYDFTAAPETATEIAAGKITLATPLNLIGESGAHLIGGFILNAGADKFSVQGIAFDGASSVDNFLEIADDAAVVGAITIRNNTFTSYKNRFAYMNKTGVVTSLEITGNVVTGIEGADFTGGDFIDFRKGTLTAVKVKNNTFANGIRTFSRIDAAVVLDSYLVENNTFYNNCYIDSKDNNGLFHVRATSLDEANMVVRKNIFASMHRAAETPSQANGYPKIVSTNTASKIPTFSQNYYYGIDAAEDYNWWTKDRVTEEVGTAGFGVVLSVDPFKDGANGDYTVTHGLVATEGIGDPRWIKGGAVSGESFPVSDMGGLLNAIDAGKSVISLDYGTYDFTTAEALTGGTLNLATGLTLKGVSKNGLKPVVIGAFKPAITDGGDLILENLNIQGVSGETKLGNMIDVDATSVMGDLVIKDCELSLFSNRLISNAGESSINKIEISGVIAHDFGTGGDFIDVRKGSVGTISVTGSTFTNGIRTFLRVDAGVNCGGVKVSNNTFFNTSYVDSKDNNGIMHVRSTMAVSPAALEGAARRIVVTRNIFASMHRAAETPSNAAGFPKLVSTASEKIAHPYITDNLFFDIDTTEGYSWWNTMTEEDIAAAGKVLEETPFSGDTAAGKFTVTSAYKGYGDTRW